MDFHHYAKKIDKWILTKTSYWIRIKWQPLRFVGGNGGTNSFSFFQSSVSLYLILPRLMEDSSRVSVSITLLRVMYWMVCKKKNRENWEMAGRLLLHTFMIHGKLKTINHNTFQATLCAIFFNVGMWYLFSLFF